MDLSEEEYEAFGRGVAALAAQRERKPRDFEAFVSFLGRNGPYGAVVDGANAALFGQNWEEGGFSFAQIQAVVAQLHCERPALKPLVVRPSAARQHMLGHTGTLQCRQCRWSHSTMPTYGMQLITQQDSTALVEGHAPSS